ncbi:MAG: hypothetical protein LBN43_01595 [Oscillospiraceae bacterium]|jgi:hypothetical protein|nr:hypothetical protein [Oscillospiraceae bacterium]
MENNERSYNLTKNELLNAIQDMVELQNGKIKLSDTQNGKLSFTVKMYGKKWEIRFQVTESENNQCNVQLDIDGDTGSREQRIDNQFALLESLMIRSSTARNGPEN